MSPSTTTTAPAVQAAHEQEALMGQTVPSQHPAVVLRSHFNQLRALLAVALIAVIGLTVAVVILAGDEDQTAGSNSAAPIGHLNNGGFNPSTGRPYAAPLPKRDAQTPITGSRYDGAPEQGTGGPLKDYSKNSATGDYDNSTGPRRAPATTAAPRKAPGAPDTTPPRGTRHETANTEPQGKDSP
jgi:hypothetical protein